MNINSKNLILSDCASIIFSFHKNIDKIREERKGVNKIGTTGRGIGPAYEDKIGRRAIRFGDLSDEDILNDKIKNILDYHNIILAGLNSQPLKFENIKKEINSFRKPILKYVKRTAPILENARLKGKRILFEGAQGVLLDVDHGTYPYVTSSNTVPSSAAVGTGISTKQIGFILGIVKAYTTRVGGGPFPSELDCEVGKNLEKLEMNLVLLLADKEDVVGLMLFCLNILLMFQVLME